MLMRIWIFVTASLCLALAGCGIMQSYSPEMNANNGYADTSYPQTTYPPAYSPWNTTHLTAMQAQQMEFAALNGNNYSDFQLGQYANAGDSEAQQFLALTDYVEYQRTYDTQYLTQAVYWMRKAAGSGLPSAEYYLGRWYSGGMGVAPNAQKSNYWMRRAAAGGWPAAQQQLAATKAGTGIGGGNAGPAQNVAPNNAAQAAASTPVIHPAASPTAAKSPALV